VSGPYLAALSEEQLSKLQPFPLVFSRVSPENKLKIVKALQRRGDVVAMGGDGVNDAAALKQADVGFAMGRTGTDLARQAADLVLLDDSYATIVNAVEEGRRVYGNIVKFIVYLLSCNLAEVLFVLAAVSIGWESPMTSMIILYANIWADIPTSLSLGVEPVEPDAMEKPPRDPHEHVITYTNGLLILLEGLSMGALALSQFIWCYVGQDQSLSYSRSSAFLLLATVQISHTFWSRNLLGSSLRRPLDLVKGNKWLLGGCALAELFILIGVYSPGLNTLLDLEPVSANDWVNILIAVVFHLLVVELLKFLVRAVRSRKGARSNSRALSFYHV
jgi:Ca2+-transporting ATPase